MRRPVAAQTAAPKLRLYLRRSKADEGYQQFSLDVQREGSRLFAAEELPRFGVDLAWREREEYVDDDRAGDDFEGRTELRRLRREIRPGDIVLCRDQSRLGRDALEVTLAIRDMVQDGGARLFYYAERREVEFANAIDAAMTFIKGTGHQMELEAIRGRVREALRSRVRAGRIAGGRCYGYSLRREKDASGREFTTAVVNPAEADIVRRVFSEYASGEGLKRIASRLNAERVPSPAAGRRGTGSWSPSCISSMLRNHRYRGLYVHGRIQRSRKGGRRVSNKAPPKDVLTIEVPEWRIIEDSLWLAVHESISRRAPTTGNLHAPNARYPLTGLARCAQCGGSIGVMNTKVGSQIVKAYGCSWHHTRGNTVCSTTVRQPANEVEEALLAYLFEHLGPALEQRVFAEIRHQIEEQFSIGKIDVEKVRAELEVLRKEQRNLARAVAVGGDEFQEIIAEMRQRADRIRNLETDLATAERTPEMVRKVVSDAEQAVANKLSDLRSMLGSTEEAERRELFRALFPEPLAFEQAEVGRRRIWKIRGSARLPLFNLQSDPDGI